jgi:hypothetical protein
MADVGDMRPLSIRQPYAELIRSKRIRPPRPTPARSAQSGGASETRRDARAARSSSHDHDGRPADEHDGIVLGVWMIPVNGIIVDMRRIPREFQEQAYELGLIPSIPD